MALKDTTKKMSELLESMQLNLTKAEKGNKAAAQRVRTESIKFGKIAKVYRKESIKAEKSGLMKRNKAVAKTTKTVKATKTLKTTKKVEKAPVKKTKTVAKQTRAVAATPKKKLTTTKTKKVAKPRSLRK